jgi:hypothetical protein
MYVEDGDMMMVGDHINAGLEVLCWEYSEIIPFFLARRVTDMYVMFPLQLIVARRLHIFLIYDQLSVIKNNH